MRIMWEYQNTKKAILQIDQKKFLSLKKVNNIVQWTFVTENNNDEEIGGSFFGKNCKR